ncbi:MAG: glycine cleavage system protein H [Bacteroidota bacterium]
MKFSSEDSRRHTFASPQFRCVWMTAGVLTYQLCDRNFECDHCELDTALQTMFSKNRSHAAVDRPDGPSRPTELTQPRFLYSRNHCWVQSMSDTVVRVGLEPEFASILLSPKAIVLPTTEDTVRQNECCFWIVLEGGTIPVKSPLDGVVRKTNPRIAQEPHEVCLDPENEGWLFELETRKDEHRTAQLLNKEQTREFYSDDMTRFRNLVADALKAHDSAVGMTMADGGQKLHNVSAMLGVRRYFELIREVFG